MTLKNAQRVLRSSWIRTRDKGGYEIDKIEVKVGRATHQAMGVFSNNSEIKQVNKLLFYPRIARSWDSWKSSDLPLSYLVDVAIIVYF